MGISRRSLLNLTYAFQLTTQIITYSTVFSTLILKDASEIIKLFNSGSELMQAIKGKVSNNFYVALILKIFLLEWVYYFFQIFANYEMLTYPKLFIFTLLVTIFGNFINMFVANIFFCGIYCTGKLFKNLNKQLKLIVKPLQSFRPLNQVLTHSQMVELSEKIEHIMIQHAKIVQFVKDFNKLFSLFCASKLLEGFVTITSDAYTFYVFSRTAPDDGSSPLSFYTCFVHISLIFSFIFASNFATEQFQKTGDILKVYLDFSVDDRLKNSVCKLSHQLLNGLVFITFSD